ncbi:hypothetical protein V1Y59_02335 [Gordonia sp. PKS22-38]|uniref:Uncharacterized protein n=1 Tax=Gordonia prachuapensis TaxID=3115651 RepID=A0ABU7MNJ7_9ACTN|nr:hypothetical protein [Gordonia sp. PKS22-38]
MSERFARRLLIEAVEGCGIRHWARIDAWDGVGCARITDLGGETFELNVENLSSALVVHLDDNTPRYPLDVDSYLADEIVQTMLFGVVIYRSEIRRRPALQS